MRQILQAFQSCKNVDYNKLITKFIALIIAMNDNYCICIYCAVLSHSVVSDSLQSHGLQPVRLLCPWGFSKQEYWSGLPCLPPGDLPNVGIKPRSPSLQADSLPSEPPGKPWSEGSQGSEQPIPSQGDLPDPGIEPGSPALQVDSLPAELPGKPINVCVCICIYIHTYICICIYIHTFIHTYICIYLIYNTKFDK